MGNINIAMAINCKECNAKLMSYFEVRPKNSSRDGLKCEGCGAVYKMNIAPMVIAFALGIVLGILSAVIYSPDISSYVQWGVTLVVGLFGAWKCPIRMISPPE